MPALGMTPKTDYVDGDPSAGNAVNAQRLNEIGQALIVLRDFIVILPNQAAYDAITTPDPDKFYFVLEG